jgi:hypothetical protein
MMPNKSPKHTAMMIPEKLDMEEITEARRKAIAASLRTLGMEELKALGEQLFPTAGDGWRENYFTFLDQNPGATYHHGVTHDGVQVIYCNARDKGIWFKPGIGMGPMQSKGRAILKQIVEGR